MPETADTSAQPIETTGTDPNIAAKVFLKSYMEAESSPGYAVLVSGSWGSGKTFLVDTIAKTCEQKPLAVSLYGITSFSQIADEIFRQLHPVLGSKSMQVAGKLLGGFAKGALKIDFGGADKETISITPSLKAADLKTFFGNPKDRLIIFDDLERCSMQLSDVLGYINSLVEHGGGKAIIVANENELNDKDENYKRVKEKLVGQTVKIVPHFESAFPGLISSITQADARSVLNSNAALIKQIFLDSQTDNLRLLRYAISDFERLCACFRQDYFSHAEAMSMLLASTVALSTDVRSGRLPSDELKYVNSTSGRRREGDLSPFDQTEQRYSHPGRLRGSPLSADVFRMLIGSGFADCHQICLELDRSPPFAAPEEEAVWRSVWFGLERSDDSYEAALSKLLVQFDAREFLKRGEVLQVFGLLICASKIGALDWTLDETKSKCIAYIDELYVSGKLEFRSGAMQEFVSQSGYQGLGFQEAETSQFREVATYYRRKSDEAIENERPADAARLLELMSEDPDEFSQQIYVDNNGQSIYWNIPLFQLVNEREFVRRLLELEPLQQQTVLMAFQSRYENSAKLAPETSWREAVAVQLRAKLPGLRPMTRHRLELRSMGAFPIFRDSTGEEAD